MGQIIYRIDDIGASSKQFEQRGRKLFKYKGIPYFYFPLANFWFLKRIWPFKKWAPYDELTENEWEELLTIFQENGIVPIVAVTACWVEKNSALTPFPEKFPGEADVLKNAFQKGKITIANHGLTHCVVGKHLPKFWGSNRKYHREFWPDLPQEVHTEHIEKSQDILEKFFEKPVEVFVPPGNVWCFKTYQALKKTNIKKVIASKYMLDSAQKMEGIAFIDDKEGFFLCHDRDLKLKGGRWLKNKIVPC